MARVLVGLAVAALCLAGLLLEVGAALLTSVGAVSLVRVGCLACRHRRVVASLEAEATGGTDVVRLVEGCGLVAVAGLMHPRIYADAQLLEVLSTSERRAVLAHETWHRMRRDPLRLLLLDSVAPLVRLLPGGRVWLARRRAAVEIAADRYALRQGAERRTLARALIRLETAVAAPGAVGYTSAVDLRLAALIGEPHDRPTRPGRWWVTAWAVSPAVAACVAMWMGGLPVAPCWLGGC